MLSKEMAIKAILGLTGGLPISSSIDSQPSNWLVNHHKGKGRNKSPHKFTGVLKVKRLAKKLKNKNR